MAFEVILPKVDADMKEGKIAEWFKHEGDKVNKGDVILSVETEKVVWDIEAETSGILGKPMSDVEDVVPVGTALVYILEAGEEDPALNK